VSLFEKTTKTKGWERKDRKISDQNRYQISSNSKKNDNNKNKNGYNTTTRNNLRFYATTLLPPLIWWPDTTKLSYRWTLKRKLRTCCRT
jgi:hypothetical protein